MVGKNQRVGVIVDPNETLRKIRRLYDIVIPEREEMDELCELVQALDDWLTEGGFLPEAWKARHTFSRSPLDNTPRKK